VWQHEQTAPREADAGARAEWHGELFGVCVQLEAAMIHRMHLEWTAPHAWVVACSCGWVSEIMGLGDAYATKARGLEDVGHATYARGLK